MKENGWERATPKRVRTAACLFMGLGHIIYLKQYIKGIFFALVEIIFLINLPNILTSLNNMITLVADKSAGQTSAFMLIDGVITIALIFLFVVIYYVSVNSAMKMQKMYSITHTIPSNRKVLSELGNNGFVAAAMAPTLILLVIFVVVPLVFSFCVAFTDFQRDYAADFGWVGLDNFTAMFGGDAKWTSALGDVALWTIFWGFAATFTCYFGGLIIAVLVNDRKVKIAPVFRTIFVLPYAVPSVISMIVWKNMLHGTFGTVNLTLMELGIIEQGIPWLGEVELARFVCIMINLWAGFPYFMLLAVGTMSSISNDIYEASQIDGANKLQTFFTITLPLVIRQTAPLIILSLMHNINNFGAIFFLTGGNPTVDHSVTTSAKGTDIIVTWIYNLTITLKRYDYASALAVMVFMILAPFAIFNFVRTKSYKEDA